MLNVEIIYNFSLLSEIKLNELTKPLLLAILSPSPLERGWGEVIEPVFIGGKGFR